MVKNQPQFTHCSIRTVWQYKKHDSNNINTKPDIYTDLNISNNIGLIENSHTIQYTTHLTSMRLMQRHFNYSEHNLPVSLISD